MMYSTFIVVDITGGMGVTTSRKLQELGYRDLYVEGGDLTNKWKWDPKAQDRIPGLNFNNKRVQIIATFEEYLRHGFIIRSSRLLNEMNTFVYVNGRPDHQKGQHDDLIMSLAMAIYVGETSFASLTRVSEQAKVMIESWQVNSNQPILRSQFIDPMTDNRSQGKVNEPTKTDYQNYSWLFGGMR